MDETMCVTPVKLDVVTSFNPVPQKLQLVVKTGHSTRERLVQRVSSVNCFIKFPVNFHGLHQPQLAYNEGEPRLCISFQSCKTQEPGRHGNQCQGLSFLAPPSQVKIWVTSLLGWMFF